CPPATASGSSIAVVIRSSRLTVSTSKALRNWSQPARNRSIACWRFCVGSKWVFSVSGDETTWLKVSAVAKILIISVSVAPFQSRANIQLSLAWPRMLDLPRRLRSQENVGAGCAARVRPSLKKRSGSQNSELRFQAIDRRLQHLGDAWDCQHL